ncbi:MAG: spermidine/putrescine ABC transporter substrate-binding protein [Ruthenibacterium sp.]
MKKILSLTLILALALTALVGCGAASSAPAVSGAASSAPAASATGDAELNLFTWEGMFPQEVLDGFTAETGIKVNYSSFDTDETMLAKLETAKGGDYDLVVADDYIVETAIAEKLVAPLDKAKITNIGNINPIYQSQFYDPENTYTVPYGAGVQTIVYNPTVIQKDIKGYADLWDASLADNLAIIGNYRVINGIALKVMGESYNATDTALIEKAGAKLLELAPNIRLIKDDNVQDDLISGEVGAAVMYTSQVTAACLANPDLKVVYPSEGVGFGIMPQFIPINAPHADAAHAFINYILKPEVSKQCFEALGYYCTNQAADALIDPAYQAFLTLPADFHGSTEMIQNITAEADEAHVKVWTEFKTACGQ